MHPHEVVISEVARQRRPQVALLPAEAVGQPREPAQVAPERPVAALDMGRTSPVLIRVPRDGNLLLSYQAGRSIPPAFLPALVPEFFDDLSIIHPASQGVLHRVRVGIEGV